MFFHESTGIDRNLRAFPKEGDEGKERE